MHGRTIIIKKVGLDQTGAALRIQRTFRHRRGIADPEKEDTGLDANGKPIMEKRPFAIMEIQDLRARIWYLMEDPTSGLGAKIIGITVMLTIFFSITCFILETDPMMQRRVSKRTWWLLDGVCTTIFVVEYVVRISVCTVFLPNEHHKITTLKQFVTATPNVIDIAAIAPFFLEILISSLGGKSGGAAAFRLLRTLRLMRLLRIVKLGRRFEGLTLMLTAIGESVTALTLLVFLLSMGITVSASLIYFAERLHCPDENDTNLFAEPNSLNRYRDECLAYYLSRSDSATVYQGQHIEFGLCCVDGTSKEFSSILEAMWWAIVTVTTVGYGDVIPRTAAGKFVGSLSMVAGILLIALPVAIVGSKFQEAYEFNHREELPPARNPVLDDIEAPDACKRKAAKAFSKMEGAEEVGKEILEATKIKRQLTYHLFAEFAALVEKSPLIEDDRFGVQARASGRADFRGRATVGGFSAEPPPGALTASWAGKRPSPRVQGAQVDAEPPGDTPEWSPVDAVTELHGVGAPEETPEVVELDRG